MNPSEFRRHQAQSGLAKAIDDLDSARALESAGYGENSLYHCQQAVEKSLKAFLTWHDQVFRKTHKLKESGDACVRSDISLEAICSDAHVLTDYAWKLRYPGDPYVIEEGEVDSTAKLAVKVSGAVQGQLSKDLAIRDESCCASEAGP